MLNREDLERVYDNDILDEYDSIEYRLKQETWNKKEFKLLHIAFYIILHKPKPKYDIKPERLKSIRKTVTPIRIKLMKHNIESSNIDWYTDWGNGSPYTSVLQQRLGKYAKYFIRDYSEDTLDNVDNCLVNDTKAKYISHEGGGLYGVSNGGTDEIKVIKNFLEDMELIKEELIDSATQAKKTSKYGYNYKTGADMKLTDLYDKMKDMLAHRLKAIDVSNSKIQRLTTNAITAIKKEILNF